MIVIILIYALFFIVLAALSYEDIKRHRIDDRFHLIILALAVIAQFSVTDVSFAERIVGFFAVSVPMLVITMVIPGAFGGGDVKLTAACGAFLGWQQIVSAAVWAVFLAGIWAVYLLVIKKKERTTAYAFGPFLCLGMVLSIF